MQFGAYFHKQLYLRMTNCSNWEINLVNITKVGCLPYGAGESNQTHNNY